MNIQLIISGLLGLSFLAQAQERPNVLFVLSDDHSVPFLGCYGHPDLQTPNLDHLAKEGVLFNHAYTTAPQCVPSRASLLTGRNVLAVDMLRFSAALPKEYKTFPEMMKAEGYFVGTCGRGYHLDGSRQPAETSVVFEELGMVTFPERFDFVHKGDRFNIHSVLEQFIDMVPDNKPFMLWVNYSDPHRPFTAKKLEPDPTGLKVPDYFPDTEGLRKDLAAHYGEIQRLDQQFGKLIRVLEKRKILEKTIIVFMGDNGAALLRGKGSLYRLGLHVPLILRYPAVAGKGIVSDVLVSGIDIAPTILELTGVKPDPGIEGKSFVNALNGNAQDNHDFIFAVRGTHGSALPSGSNNFDMSRTVMNRDYKLIYNPMWQNPYVPADFDNASFWKELREKANNGELEQKFNNTVFFTPNRPMFEFFDLNNDPYEFKNLADHPDYSEIQQQFKAALQRWMIINRDVVPLPVPYRDRNAKRP